MLQKKNEKNISFPWPGGSWSQSATVIAERSANAFSTPEEAGKQKWYFSSKNKLLLRQKVSVVTYSEFIFLSESEIIRA